MDRSVYSHDEGVNPVEYDAWEYASISLMRPGAWSAWRLNSSFLLFGYLISLALATRSTIISESEKWGGDNRSSELLESRRFQNLSI